MQGGISAGAMRPAARAAAASLCRRPPSLLLDGGRRQRASGGIGGGGIGIGICGGASAASAASASACPPSLLPLLPRRRRAGGGVAASAASPAPSPGGGGSVHHHGACPTNAADAGGSNGSATTPPQQNFAYGSLDDSDVEDDDSAAFWHRPRAPPSFHLRQNGYDRDVVKVWDRDKEAGRVHRRQLFSFIDWQRHRSSYRYVHQLETLLSSRVLRGLLWPVIMFSTLAAMVVAWQSLAKAVASGALLAAAPAWLAPAVPAALPSLPVVPLEVFSLVSFAMALLLGSRISTSYGRWNEARQSFGRITTTARNMFRQSLALLPPEATGARALMCRWLIAYVRCAKWYLREDEPLKEELEPWLTRSELRALLRSPHPPNYCLAVLSRVLASTTGLDSYALVRLEEGLSDMMRGLSACDRILNTPAPLMFSRHATRLLTLFLVLLPLGLYPAMGVGCVFAEAIVAFALTGIEEVGISIEEPLSILPLEKLCVKAERQIADMLRIDAAVLAYVSREQTARGSAGGVSPPQPVSVFTDEGPLREDYGGPSMASAMRERAAMLKAAAMASTVVSSSSGATATAAARAGRAAAASAGAGGPTAAAAAAASAAAAAGQQGAGSSGGQQQKQQQQQQPPSPEWAAVSSMDPEDIVQRRGRGGSPLIWSPRFSPRGGGGGGGGAGGGGEAAAAPSPGPEGGGSPAPT